MSSVQDLRKIYSAQGIKGFSSANRAAFSADIETAHLLALAENDTRDLHAAAAAHHAAPQKGICEDCGRKIGKSGHPTLCELCYDYAGWENTHQDGHGDGSDEQCPVCHPELDPRKPVVKSRSRAGMVIIAKGSEVHKSNTFKAAAEAAGWTVSVLGSVTTVQEDNEEFEIERFVAVAKRGEDVMEMAWNGRAYDYPASSATLGGKVRKVRNLKEALRLL